MTKNMKIRKWVALLIAILLLFCCVGCAPSNAQPKVENPPYYEAVYSNLGQNLDTVVTAMGLRAEDFTEWVLPWIWRYKDTVSYQGYDFMMILEANNDRVTAIKYVLFYDNAPEEAAAAVIDLREKLEGYGEPYDSRKYSSDTEPFPMETVTREELEKDFSDPEAGRALGLQWILSTDLSNVPLDADASRQPTCISVMYEAGYPDESGKEEGVDNRVCIALTYGLSYAYVAE